MCLTHLPWCKVHSLYSHLIYSADIMRPIQQGIVFQDKMFSYETWGFGVKRVKNRALLRRFVKCEPEVCLSATVVVRGWCDLRPRLAAACRVITQRFVLCSRAQLNPFLQRPTLTSNAAPCHGLRAAQLGGPQPIPNTRLCI